MKKQLTYRNTIFCSYIGYITQAMVNNFYPLLFVWFEKSLSVSMAQLSLLIASNFFVQLCTDFAATFFVDKIGYKASVVIAHFLSGLGFLLLPVLPFKLGFIGLLISTVISAIGGGLIEVVVSPIVEACPIEDEKSGAMSMLHSFYSWGQLAVVLISTLVFKALGVDFWRQLSVIWALVPIINGFLFLRVPVFTLPKDRENGGIFNLFKNRMFWIFFVMMLCAGAAELTLCQWASAFAEQGLGVSKTVGDLLGPCMFALFMGISRVVYSRFSEKINLTAFIVLCSVLCIAAYLLAAFASIPLLGFAGCALCGFSVGIMWPGTYSISAKVMPYGGAAMFALLALAGDLGCTLGPSLAGWVSSSFGADIRLGFALATLFPAVMLVFAVICRNKLKKIS